MYFGITLLAVLQYSLSLTGSSFALCPQERELKEIFTSLHDAITKYAIEDDWQHVDLLPLGTSLQYEDFNPGKKPKFATPGTLPIRVIDNGKHLVDRIFPTGKTVSPVPTNDSQGDIDYNFDSLSSTFDFILSHMMVKPRNFSSERKLKAKIYLQELVPNPELVIQNKSVLPRFLLYDYYRSNYLQQKEHKEKEKESRRFSTVTQEDYVTWGVKYLSVLESDEDAAYQKWVIFGYKTEVENELQYFAVDTHEDKLMSTQALFKSMGVYSEKEPNTLVYPFTFAPEKWYQLLNLREPESADQLRYLRSLLKTQQAVLNGTSSELAKETSEDLNSSLEKIKAIKANLLAKINNAVDHLLQIEVDCFANVNLTVCSDIMNTHSAFKMLLSDVAKHYEQAAYLESILNSRTNVRSVLAQKLRDLAAEIKEIDTRISEEDRAEARELLNLDKQFKCERTICQAAGKIHFSFHKPKLSTVDCVSDMDNEKYCSDVKFPLNVTNKQELWSVKSCTVDNELLEFDDILSDFKSVMSSIETDITAILHKVDIKRPWFDHDIFKESGHYTMKLKSGKVSPGPVQPLNYFHQVAESGKYLMPQFTSSFVLASNVTVLFRGIGNWRDEDGDANNGTGGIMNILAKYAYASTIEGGYGPFSFAPKGGSRGSPHNFRVERRKDGIQIKVLGAQIIGFISTTIPKFPLEQNSPPSLVACTINPASEHTERQRRYADEEPEIESGQPIRKLLNRIFLKSSDIPILSEYTPSESMEKLIIDSELTENKIDQMLQRMELSEA